MIGYIGAAFVLGIAAIGSAIGIGAAGNAAIGAWKRCYMNNKPAPFILTVFAGAPLTQTIYGFLLMQQLRDKLVAGTIEPAAALILGIFSGLAMAASAIAQGKAEAPALPCAIAEKHIAKPEAIPRPNNCHGSATEVTILFVKRKP